MNGMPASARFMPPCSGMTSSGDLLILPEHDVVLEEDRIACRPA